MSESGGMNVNRLTAGGQTVATDVKENNTTLAANLSPAGSTTAMNLTWDSDNKLRSADIDANGTADVRPSCAWHRFCQSIQVDSSTGSCFQAAICRDANGPPE